MTRKQFEERAIRSKEQLLGIPCGWWGTYNDVTDGSRRVHRSRGGGTWIVSLDGKIVSRHDSRCFAIRKAARL